MGLANRTSPAATGLGFGFGRRIGPSSCQTVAVIAGTALYVAKFTCRRGDD